MFCSKIGGECPHSVVPDDKYVFVMTPFKGFDSVYDAIKQAVEGVEGKDFRCERANDKYTNLSIWCKRICKNIRKAKYLIVDTTGRNPNVFYELGFAHTMDNTKAIIVTQNIEEAPFDIADINHIVYSEKNLPELREKLKNAILELEREEAEEGYANKSTEEIINDLKSQLRKEEDRSGKFKKEVVESEKREEKLKKHIKELESIQNNPEEEAKNKIAELGGIIAELKSKLKYTEKNKKNTIKQLTNILEEKEEKLKILEEKFESYKKSQDVKDLSDLLLDDTKRYAEAEKWFHRAVHESQKGNQETAVKYYSKTLELDPEDIAAYYNRAITYSTLKKYEKAGEDFIKAMRLDPEDSATYYKTADFFLSIKEYKTAIENYNKGIELDPDPKDVTVWQNFSELNIITDDYKSALKTIAEAFSLSHEIEDVAVCLYLECISKKMLDMDISDCEKAFKEILKKDFEITWLFDEIESWIEKTDISEDKKTFITEKTELLKKHKR